MHGQQNMKKKKLRHVRLSVPMEKLSSHWNNFEEMLCLSIFGKSVEKFKVSLKSNNNQYCT